MSFTTKRLVFLVNLMVLVIGYKVPSHICNNRNLYGNLADISIWREDYQDYRSVLRCCNEKNRNNDTLRVLINELEPFIIIDTHSELIGFLGDIWTILTEVLNYTYTLRSVSYHAGLKLMENGEGDIFLAPVVVDSKMKNVIFSQPFSHNWYELYMKSPELQINSSFYMKPFTTQLWILTAVSFIILTVIIWGTGKILKKVNPVEPNMSIPACFLGAIAGLINQGFELKFSSYSARIINYLSLLLGFMLYSAITAVLYSRMTIFDIHLPITSLEDIRIKRTMSLCVRVDTIAFDHYFKNNYDDEIRPEWKGILNKSPCLDVSYQRNIKEVICKEKVIIMSSKIVMDSFFKRTKKLPCSVIKLNHMYLMNGNSFLLAPDLNQRINIQKVFIKLKSAGVLWSLKRKYVQNNVNTSGSFNNWYQITIYHIIGVLIFYFGMIILSLIILAIEILCAKKTLCAKNY